MALADQDAGAPHGFINPTLYLMRGTGGLRDVTGGHDSLAVLRNALVGGHIVTRLRSIDRDSSLDTGARLGSGDRPRLAVRAPVRRRAALALRA